MATLQNLLKEALEAMTLPLTDAGEIDKCARLQSLAKEALASFSEENCSLRQGDCVVFQEALRELQSPQQISQQGPRTRKGTRKNVANITTIETLFHLPAKRALELLEQRCLPVNKLPPAIEKVAGRILGHAWIALVKRIMAAHGLPWPLYKAGVKATLAKRNGYIHWRGQDMAIYVEAIANDENLAWINPCLLVPSTKKNFSSLSYSVIHAANRIPQGVGLVSVGSRHPFVAVHPKMRVYLANHIVRERLETVAKLIQRATEVSLSSGDDQTIVIQDILAQTTIKMVQTLAHTQETFTHARAKSLGKSTDPWQTLDDDTARGIDLAANCLRIWLQLIGLGSSKDGQIDKTSIDPLRMLTAWLLLNSSSHFIQNVNHKIAVKARKALLNQEKELAQQISILEKLPPSHFFVIHATFAITGMTKQHANRPQLANLWYEKATQLLLDNTALHAPRHPCGWPAGLHFGHQLYERHSIMGHECGLAFHRAFVIFDLLVETIRQGQPVRALSLSRTFLSMCAQTLYTISWIHQLRDANMSVAYDNFAAPTREFAAACVETHSTAFFELFFAVVEVLTSLPHTSEQAAEYSEMGLLMATLAPPAISERGLARMLNKNEILEEVSQSFLMLSLTAESPDLRMHSIHGTICRTLKNLHWPKKLADSYDQILTGEPKDRLHLARKMVAGMQRQGIQDAEDILNPQYQDFARAWLGKQECQTSDMIAFVSSRLGSLCPYGSPE